MRRIIFILMNFLFFMVFAGLVNSKEPGRILRDDCHLSFSVPKGVEYVEVDGAVATGKDECYLAFEYTGDLRIKLSGNMPAIPEDWRAMTDFSLTVKAVPVADSLAQLESADGVSQQGLFKIISREHVSLSGGDLYVVGYVATHPTKTMIKSNEVKGIIFVAGNNERSIAFPLYSGWRLSKVDKERERVLRDLFSSIRFI